MKAIAAIAPALFLALLLPAGAGAEPGAELETVRVAGGKVADGEVIARYRGESSERIVELGDGVEVGDALRELRRDPEVAWVAPNPVARASRIPKDRGRSDVRAGWQLDQWNFLAPPRAGAICSASRPCGVNAVRAWDLLRRKDHPEGRRRSGKRGPIVAVVDTGVAYRNKGKRFRRSPELAAGAFVKPRDFEGKNQKVALDRNGHGTHVASTIIERTGNRDAVTGLGDGLRVMPVRVLNRDGSGRSSNVAAGIRYAARNGAKVINLSLEFGGAFDTCADLRLVCSAIREAERKGAIVVSATGNAGLDRAQMPAKVSFGVAASTIRGCISRFSSRGRGTDISAPGGGPDLNKAGSHCDGSAAGPGIVQLTLSPSAAFGGDYTRFGFPRFEGTSMAAPHVSAAAALVLGSGVLRRQLGHNPEPAELEQWLQCTARPPTDPATAELYGAGTLDLAAALRRRSSCPELGI